MSVFSKPAITDLPLEVMTEIWMLLRRSPASLSRIIRVSRQWNSAKAIPSLWGNLNLNESTDCVLLSLWLARAQSSALDISIDFHRSPDRLWHPRQHSDSPAEKLSPQAVNTKLVALMDILELHSLNWRTFQIRGAHYLGPILKIYLSSLLPTPRLLQVSILLEQADWPVVSTVPHDTSLFHYIIPALPILHAEIASYPLVWHSFPFQTLTSLTLGPCVAANPLSWDMFAVALGDAPHLMSVAFTGAIPSITQLQPAPHLHLTLPAVHSLTLSLLASSELQHLTQYMLLPALQSLILRLTDEADDFLPFMQEVPARFPNLTKLSIDRLWISPARLAPFPPFFEYFSGLTCLRLNFDTTYGLDVGFWQALLRNAHNSTVLPSLTSVVLVDVPLSAAQDLVFLRMQASRPILHLSIYRTEPLTALRTPAWTRWLMDNTRELSLTYGHHNPWAPATFDRDL
ncbi:hypothetical protein DFH09DRAFT_1331934 [Mycena vulgaris]|nr:hypothetical protein DFH09DRAFT_1331934 [Mycena vulgaris]